MAISASFAQILAAGRAQFNQRASEARRRFPAFDTDAFADFLQTGVDQVTNAVAAAMPERAAATALVAYDMALELVGLDLAGPMARSKLLSQAWRELAPAYARLIAEQPAQVLGALSNAAINLGKAPFARPQQWLAEMAALAPAVTTLPQLLVCGQILAWRAGMAHFRQGAIQAAEQIPPALALAALGVNDGTPWAAIHARLLADPWWAPSIDPVQVQAGIEIGRFTGFGGEFAAPPEVRPCAQGFFVKSDERYYFLVADAYGAVLHTAVREEFEHAGINDFHATATIRGSHLLIGERRIELDLPPEQITVTCNAHSVAVSSPFTHAILLLPLQS
ncbi:hypothetical protein [Collimonas fungivorans]|uniref:hypothetical protein n=1 Tax=Collimonas fungivorans TaxID=158899 RepID=UPI003FA38340